MLLARRDTIDLETFVNTHPYTLESMNNRIDLYEAWDNPKKATEWRAKLPQTEAVKE